MSEKMTEERDASPVLASPKPAGASAADTTAAPDASAQTGFSSKQRIQQLRERLAQYNVSIAENLSANAPTSTGAGKASVSEAARPAPATTTAASPLLPTAQLARSLSSEFQQSAGSHTAPAQAAASLPRPTTGTASSPVRQAGGEARRETGASSGPSSPLRHAPQPINPKMMNDITSSLPTPMATGSTSTSTTTTNNNNASASFAAVPASTSAFARATSVGNPFQAERTTIHQPRQRASVDMMEEAVRRSSTASTEAAIRAAQQEAQQQQQQHQHQLHRTASGNLAGSSSPVHSPSRAQAGSGPARASATTTSTRTGPAANHARARGTRLSPSPDDPAMGFRTAYIDTSDEEEEEEDEDEEDSSEYEEMEFDVEEIEEEYEETDTSAETSSYDDDDHDDGFDDEDDEEAVNAFLKELLEKDDFIRGAVEKTLSQSGQPTQDGARSMNPLIRRAAELYRQRRQAQQHDLHTPSSPHRDPVTKDLTAAPSAASPTGAFSPTTMVAEAEARGGRVSFGALETAYCHLVAAQIGAQKLHNRTQLDSFPGPLPMLSESAIMSARRDELVASIQELCRTPATQRQLTSLRQTEATALDKRCTDFIADCGVQVEAKALKVVEDQQNIVLGKQRLLAERHKDLEERRVACRAVREETLKIKRRNATRTAQLASREATHARRLEDHTTLEASTQARIAEVEQLGKKVAWWLRVLEERNTGLTQKEERLHTMEADVARRRGDLQVFKTSQSRNSKPLPPPPPPPPRATQEKRH